MGPALAQRKEPYTTLCLPQRGFVGAHNALSGVSSNLDAKQAKPRTTLQGISRLGCEAPSVLDNIYNVHFSLEAFRERLLRNFTGRGIPKGERLETLAVEIVLDSEQALRGGALLIGIPVYQRCPACSGMHLESLFPCARCDARGMVEEVRTVAITIPAVVVPREHFELSLEDLGIHNLFLQAHVSVCRAT
jgi:hypothetical protein